MKIAYSALIKNPKRKKAPYYGRIRQDGREKFIPLNTENKTEAMKWVKRQQNVLFQVNEYLEAGQQVPDALMAKLLTVDTPAFAQKGSSKPVSAPGGILDAWEADARSRGFREATMATYQRAFRLLLADEAPESLTVEKVRSMITSRASLSNNTRRHYCNALRSLFTFMRRDDLARALPRIKPEESSHVYWSELDMAEIIAEVSSDTAERTLQYKDYFGVLAAIGSRNTETYLLKWENLNEDQSITFPAHITKAGKTRTVPIPYSLWAQLEVRRGRPEERIFSLVSPSQSRRYRVLQRAVDRLGLPGSGMHMFRRSRSVLLYRKVKDIKICAALLGDSEAVALKHYQDAVTMEEVRRAAFDE